VSETIHIDIKCKKKKKKASGEKNTFEEENKRKGK
jgi:hypothetical protein